MTEVMKPVVKIPGLVIPLAPEAIGAVATVAGLLLLAGKPELGISVLMFALPAYLVGRAVRLLGAIADNTNGKIATSPPAPPKPPQETPELAGRQ